MCYAATHPEKLDAAKQAQWQKLARLRPEDMATVVNLEYLGVPVRKRGKVSTALVFGRKRKRAVRKVRLSCAKAPVLCWLPCLHLVGSLHASVWKAAPYASSTGMQPAGQLKIIVS